MKKFLVAMVSLVALTTGFVVAAASTDVGPKADVAAVKAAQHRADSTTAGTIVHVLGNYALVDWWTQHASGGAAYKRVSGEQWKRLITGGGVLMSSMLVKAGIPAPTAAKLCAGWGDSRPCMPG